MQACPCPTLSFINSTQGVHTNSTLVYRDADTDAHSFRWREPWMRSAGKDRKYSAQGDGVAAGSFWLHNSPPPGLTPSKTYKRFNRLVSIRENIENVPILSQPVGVAIYRSLSSIKCLDQEATIASNFFLTIWNPYHSFTLLDKDNNKFMVFIYQEILGLRRRSFG